MDNTGFVNIEEDQRYHQPPVNNNRDSKEDGKKVSINGETFQTTDFDDVLDHIGGWGPFQYLVTFMFFFTAVFLGHVSYSPILTLYTPPHWCHVPALSNYSLELRRQLAIPKDESGKYSQCSQYIVDWDMIDKEDITKMLKEKKIEDLEVGKCNNGWDYQIEGYHRSAASDFDWVCDRSWVGATSQSIFFLGAVPGMLMFGWLSDHYGRIPTIVLSNIIGMITGIATPFVTDYISYFVLRFIMGLSYNTFFICPYVLAMEFVEKSKRTMVGNLGLAFCLTLSGVVQPWIVRQVDWKIFNWILFSQMGLAIFVPLFMPESVRWLMSRGEGEKSVKIIKKIAKMNGRQVPSNILTSVLDLCEHQKKENTLNMSSGPSYLDLFRTSSMRRITFLIMFLWMSIYLLFDATIRNISNLDISIYTSFMISAGLELPADLLAIVGLNYLGRRWSSFISLLATSLVILPAVWLHSHPNLTTFFALSGRFFATYAMNTGVQFTVEVMPTEIRGQGTALVNVMSMLATIGSPYIVYSSVLSPELPYLLIAVLGLLASFPGLFLPETAGVNLMQSIGDADTFGRNDKFFWIPLCGSEGRLKNSNDNKDGVEGRLKYPDKN